MFNIDRLVMWFWMQIHPCRLGFSEYDHDWTFVDDSFDHEFGTEMCGHWECESCGEVDEDREPPGPDDFDYSEY